MARKSRKIISDEMPLVTEKIYKTAVYIRLSVEERRDRKDSESLDTQKQLVLDYIAKDPSLLVCGIYADNGETGTDFDRPEFQRMIYDISKGLIDCIVVKDLSRFGRNHIETGDYLDNFFPMIGVRFIAINDNYDSNILKPNDGLIIPLKNIINSIYAKDISKKSSTALRIKQAKGEFLGAYAPYGYLKDPDDGHKLIIDQETAPIVKDIFKWKAEGMGTTAISRRLLQLGIVPPCKYRYQKGILKDPKYEKLSFWQCDPIKKMLQNPVYLGHVTQGKRKSHFYENMKTERIRPEEWVIVRDTHEPIIEQDVFDKVQEIMLERKVQYTSRLGKHGRFKDEENIYRGLLICGSCKTNLTRHKTVKPNNVYYYQLCPTHAQHLDICPFSRIEEKRLTEAVTLLIKNEISSLINLEKLLERARKSKEVCTQINDMDMKIRSAQSNLKRLVLARKALFSDYVKAVLSEKEYLYAKKEYDAQNQVAEAELEILQKQKVSFLQCYSETKWLSELKKYRAFNLLTKEMLHTFVRKIEVYSDHSIYIEWNYADEYYFAKEALKGEFANEKAV